jgi:hypothetical protein
MNELESLNWSAPKVVKTYNGERVVRVAQPTPAFWGAWRSNKEDLKAAGVSCRKDRFGSWEVCRWSDVASEAVNEAAGVIYPTLVESPRSARVAERIEGFVAPPISLDIPWSEEQHTIFAEIRDGSGNFVIFARAGTGKTTVCKYGLMLAPERRIAYLVFLKKNQIEAQAKITDPRVEVLTMNALGYRFVRMFWPNARPDDEVEKYRVAVACGQDSPDEARAQVLKLVAFAKNCCLWPTVAELMDLADERGIELPDFESLGWTVERLAACALEVLKLSKVRDSEGRISYNDQVWLPVVMGWVVPLFDLIVLDEGQDTNLPGITMARKAVRTGGRMGIVGDDWQAIYGFRGAMQDGMAKMMTDLEAKRFPLTITRRCPKVVVRRAQQLVSDYRAADDAPEGAEHFIRMNLLTSSVQVGDAILSRLNAPLTPVCLQLLRKGIPARIEGKDIGKQLKGIATRLNARSVPQFITKLENWAERMTNRARGSKRFEQKAELINDQKETLMALADGVANVREISERIDNIFEDTKGESRPAVILSSTHKAKGLEWDRVFVLDDTYRQKEGEGEEARLYYVAITRTKKEIFYVSGEPENKNN